MADTTYTERILPAPGWQQRAKSLIGFEDRWNRLSGELRLFLDTEGLELWSKTHYGERLALLDSLRDRYPLAIFYGDVGTGKTATAVAFANALANSSPTETALVTVSTAVRGEGRVGEMGTLLTQVFAAVAAAAGKTRRVIVILDEADSLTSARTDEHSHHEDKVAVNTLIQQIDDLRAFGGRVLVIACTNRFDVLDPAIVRRAMLIEQFDRPDETSRREVFSRELMGTGISSQAIEKLVALTGPSEAGPGFTYSDIRTRLLPAALVRCYPDYPLTEGILLEIAQQTRPSPTLLG